MGSKQDSLNFVRQWIKRNDKNKERQDRKSDQEYAIVGISGQYPRSKNVDELWKNLIDNQNCISEISDDRYDWRAVHGDPKTEVGKTNIKHFGLLENIYSFDASFFKISNREAEAMDPHMRLLIENSWSCIENAGYSPDTLKGSQTGVFVSFYNYDYMSVLDKSEIEKATELYLSTGRPGTIMANRLSFLLDLRGPSEVYNTACSTALTALHHAMQSIAAGDCAQALLAGVSLLLSPSRVITLSKLGILNQSDVCNPFCYPANKEVIGEGVGVIMVKPFKKALQDKDYIYAVISGSDICHSGRSSGYLTMPAKESLKKLMVSTYKKLNIDPKNICYIEGHGSGNDTDIVELIAYDEALFELGLDGEHKVSIGSIKSNIGFGEGSGGMAQLTKCALSLDYGRIPATLHMTSTDPSFNLKQSRLLLHSKNSEIINVNEKTCVSIFAYGFGGSNAHIIMRPHMPEERKFNYNEVDVFPLLISAKSEDVLLECVIRLHAHFSNNTPRRYMQYFKTESDLLKSLSLTLINRERYDPCRVVICVHKYDDIIPALYSIIKKESNPFVIRQKEENGKVNVDIQALMDQRNIERLSRLWISGVSIDWQNIYRTRDYQKLPLSTVPFIGKTFKLREKKQSLTMGHDQDNVNLGSRMLVETTDFGTNVSIQFKHNDVIIAQHVVDGIPVLPAAGYLALLSKLARSVFKQSSVAIKNIVWLLPFEVSSGISTMDITFNTDGKFRIVQRETQRLCCKGSILMEKSSTEAFNPRFRQEYLDHECVFDKNTIWKMVNSPGSKQNHGNFLRRLSEIYVVDNMSLGKLDSQDVPVFLEDCPFYDSSFITAFGVNMLNRQKPALIVPFSLDMFYSILPIDTRETLYAITTEKKGKLPRYNISIEDGNGTIYAIMEGFFGKEIDRLPKIDMRHENVAKIKGEKSVQNTDKKEERKKVDMITDEILTVFFVKEFRQIMANFLKFEIDEIPTNENLEDLGLDSIGINELTDQISQDFQFDLPATIMFEYENIEEMVIFLIDEYKGELTTCYQQRMPLPSYPKQVAKAKEEEIPENEVPVLSNFSKQVSEHRNTDIAIIGIGGLFPGADNFKDFWIKLKSGYDFIAEVPEPRRSELYSAFKTEVNSLGGIYGAFVEDAEKFDADFFDFSDEQVMAMDPQQRLFLQATWYAIEDAGYNPLSFSNQAIGVYVGAIVNEYAGFVKATNFKLNDKYLGTGNVLSGIANRTSYFFNFNGPSMVIDSACCSGLYAIDQAVNAINNEECASAIVGGVNFISGVDGFLTYQSMDYLAKDWRCKSFAKDGDGWSKGEVFGAIFLKKYEDAWKDNDHIYAVIKSIEANHGGRAHFYEQPNSNKHVALVKDVYNKANLDPRNIVHIEAHGTGTEIGDAMEFNVMQRALREIAKEKHISLPTGYCGISSVKSNIGHAEAACSIAGFLKTVMILHEGVMPPLIHLDKVNPQLKLDKSPLFLVDKLCSLPTHNEGVLNCAAVHSFNFSGATVHALLSQAPAKPKSENKLGLSVYPVCISAKSKSALRQYCQLLSNFFLKNQVLSTNIDQIVYTINRSKSSLNHRLGMIVNSYQDLIESLQRAYTELSQSVIHNNEKLFYSCIEKKSMKKPQYSVFNDSCVLPLMKEWLVNLKFDWSLVLDRYPIQKMSLPGYPFDNKVSYFPSISERSKNKIATTASDIRKEKTKRSDTLKKTSPIIAQSRTQSSKDNMTLSLNNRDKTKQSLLKIISELTLVSVEAIDQNGNMNDYELNSIQIIDLSTRINRIFDVETTPAEFFDIIAFSDLVEFVEIKIGENVERVEVPTADLITNQIEDQDSLLEDLYKKYCEEAADIDMILEKI